jgi:hypothetical protein
MTLRWLVDVQVLFCVLSVVGNLLIVRRMILALDADIKLTRRLLMLLPDDVVHSVKALKDALLDFNSSLSAD